MGYEWNPKQGKEYNRILCKHQAVDERNRWALRKTAKNSNTVFLSEPNVYLREHIHTFSYLKNKKDITNIGNQFTRKNDSILRNSCVYMPLRKGKQSYEDADFFSDCRSATKPCVARDFLSELATRPFVAGETRRNSAVVTCATTALTHFFGRSATKAVVTRGSLRAARVIAAEETTVLKGYEVERICFSCVSRREDSTSGDQRATDKCARVASSAEPAEEADKPQKLLPRSATEAAAHSSTYRHDTCIQNITLSDIPYGVETSFPSFWSSSSYCAPTG